MADRAPRSPTGRSAAELWARVAGRLLGSAGRWVWRAVRDLGALGLLLLTGLVAALTDRRLKPAERDLLATIGAVAAGAVVAGGWLAIRVDRRVGLAAAAAIVLVAYHYGRRDPDPRQAVLRRVEAAVVARANVDPAEVPRGLVRGARFEGDRHDRRTLGLTSCTVHYTERFEDGRETNRQRLRDQIASNLGAEVDLEWRTAANYAIVRVRPPDQTETDRVITWPYVRRERLSVWDPIPVGLDERGQPVEVRLFANNVLIGGVMGYGKSTMLQLLASAVALDPDAGDDLLDGKLLELWRWAPLARRFVSVTPSGQPDMVGALDLLDDLQADINARRLFLARRGEQKVRPQHGMPLRLTIIDELAEFMPAKGSDRSAQFASRLMTTVRLSRALGLPVAAGMVRPSSTAITTDLRDLFNVRVSFRQQTAAGRKMVLGDHYDVEEPDRPGNAWLLDERARLTKVRGFMVTPAQMRAIGDRGIRLRGLGPAARVRRETEAELERLLQAVEGDDEGEGAA